MGANLTGREAEVYRLFLSLLPPGHDQLYDLGPEGDFAAFFGAIARHLTSRGFEAVDTLRAEVLPQSAEALLPEWEAATGIASSPTVTYGTVADRRAAVIARLREAGSYSRPEVRAIVGVILGYTDPSQLVIVETDRAALRTLHTYENALGGSIPVGGIWLVQTIGVNDDSEVSAAGVRLEVTLNHPDYSQLAIRLFGPTGIAGQAQSVWIPSGAGSSTLVLTDSAVAGKTILGTWTLQIASSGVGGTITSWRLFVEGVGRDAGGSEGRGAEAFWWAAYADPALEGVSSASDHAAALRALGRIKPAHTRATLLTTLTPVPGALVPGEFIPSS